jgi:hypothetical protein
MSGPGSAGDQWISTLHTTSAGNIATVHGAWQDFVANVFVACLRALWTPATAITDMETVALDPITGKQAEAIATGDSMSGTDAVGHILTPRDCIVISKRTALPTKAGRGRMYLPAPSSAHLGTNGLLAGTVATQLATIFASAMTTMKATATPVVYHHATKSVDVITHVGCGQVLGTQTRRTNRVFNAYATANL